MNTFLEEKTITLVTLSLELEQAAIAHTLQDNHQIYVHENGMFPFWIKLHPQTFLIALSTYLDVDAAVPLAQHHALCNQLNSESFLPAVHIHEQRLYADHAIYYRDGLIRSQFIRLCRLFTHGVERVRGAVVAVADGEPKDRGAF